MINFTTGTGRIVMGSLTTPQTKDRSGNVLKTPRYFIGLALPKNDPLTNEFIGHIVEEAKQAGVHPGRDAGLRSMEAGVYPLHPNFPLRQYAWKFDDGDVSPDKPGYAGCFIFKLQQNFIPRVKNWDGTAEIVDPSQMKTGFWARVVVGIKFNGVSDENAGCFLNPTIVCIQREDAELGGVDAVEALAGGIAPTGAALSFGVAPPPAFTPPTPPQATPTAPYLLHKAPAPAPPQATPTAPAFTPPVPLVPTTPTAPAFTPPTPPTPTLGEVTYEMTDLAQGATREAWEKAGYSVERLLEEGIMIAKNSGAMNP